MYPSAVQSTTATVLWLNCNSVCLKQASSCHWQCSWFECVRRRLWQPALYVCRWLGMYLATVVRRRIELRQSISGDDVSWIAQALDDDVCQSLMCCSVELHVLHWSAIDDDLRNLRSVTLLWRYFQTGSITVVLIAVQSTNTDAIIDHVADTIKQTYQR